MFVDEKRQGEAQAEPKPSLAGFIAWLEKQPADGTYNWGSAKKCAVAQYAESIASSFCLVHEAVELRDGVRLDTVAYGGGNPANWTFGSAFKRARKAAS